MTRFDGGDPAQRDTFGEETCACPGRLNAFVEGMMAKAKTGEDLEDFFMEAPLPDSALEAMTVAMETGTPQTWECEHGRRHLSGLFVEGDES